MGILTQYSNDFLKRLKEILDSREIIPFSALIHGYVNDTNAVEPPKQVDMFNYPKEGKDNG